MESEIIVKAQIIIKFGREEVVITEEEAKELQAKLNALFPQTNPYWMYPPPAPYYSPTTTDGTGGNP